MPSAARTACRCDRNGSAATLTRMPSRVHRLMVPPASGRLGRPSTCSPSSPSTGRYTWSIRGWLSWFPAMTTTSRPSSRSASSVRMTSPWDLAGGAAVPDRDVRLGDEHRARLGERGPLPLRRREVSVLRALRLGGVKAAGDPDRAVRQDPALDLARGLLGADEDHSERAAAFGQVKQDLLDRAVAFAWCVLVELVEHDEHERACRALPLLAGELGPQGHADHEPLRPIAEVVQVDDRDLGTRGAYRAFAAVRQVAADDHAQRRRGRPQPPEQGVDTAHHGAT